jgi:hypothetical protein
MSRQLTMTFHYKKSGKTIEIFNPNISKQDSFALTNNGFKQFLNKAIEVTGTVSDVKKNQAGSTVVYLKSDDPIYGVNCTFKQDPGIITKGSTITFKGICTGYLSDVVINEGIMIK